jgi:hypothetical protein
MTQFRPPRWWLALALFALFLMTTALAVAAPNPLTRLFTGNTGTGYDPLTEREIETVSQQALADPAVIAQLENSGRQELLLIERHQEDKSVYERGNWDRRADLFIYDYDSDALVHAIYNLSTSRVDSVSRSQSDQLPLTPNEVNQAIAIAFNDAQLRSLLNQEYGRVTGGELTGPEQVEIKAFTFHASALPDMELGTAATCGLNRCAQLLIFTRESVTFELLPIINLSNQQVALIPFGASNGQ